MLTFITAAVLVAAVVSAIIVFGNIQYQTIRDRLSFPLPFGSGPAPTGSAADATVFAPSTDASGVTPTVILSGPFNVVNATTMLHDGNTYRLAYIQGLDRDDVCLNSSALRFPCGLMARASLQNLIGAGTITCNPVFYPNESVPRYRCTLDTIDLSRHQVAAGFAIADALGMSVYGIDQTLARRAAVGAWDGGWNVLELQ